jgi:prevent-host-death family protein
METISISKFKATCLALLERVRQTGEPIVITKRGVPIAQVVPPPPSADKPPVLFGAMKGRMEIRGDIVGPTSSIDEWTGDERNVLGR